MAGILKKLFGGSGKDREGSSPALSSDDLRRIDRALAKAGSGRDAARLLNRAGDLCLAQGERQDALKRYGDAIDAYLQAGEYDNAMAVCRKIIRVVPEVIRTRRTLAWLCLGKGFLDIAREHIEAYTAASLEAGLAPLAVQHIQLMAQYVDRGEFREFLAERLAELGDSTAAEQVREGRASQGVMASGWTPVVFAAMLTPEELQQAIDEGIQIKAPTAKGPPGVAVENLDSLLFDPEAAKKASSESEDAESSEPETGGK